MGSESTTSSGTETAIDKLTARIEELERQFDAEVEEGRARLTELADELRRRVDELRGVEPEPSRVERLTERFDELAAAIDETIDESTDRLETIVDDIRAQLRAFERRVRDR